MPSDQGRAPGSPLGPPDETPQTEERTGNPEIDSRIQERPVSVELFLLIKRASEIEEILQFAQGVLNPSSHGPLAWLKRLRSPLPEETPQEVAKRWSTLFADELTTVRLVRNSIVHNRPISHEDAETALEIADYVLSVIKPTSEQPENLDLGPTTSDGPDTAQGDQQAE